MRVTFIGGGSGDGGSPRLWQPDDQQRIVIQGYRTGEDACVEIPHELLSFAVPGTRFPAFEDTGCGTYLVRGDLVDDAEALEIMNIPGHEAAVEIALVQGAR